MIKPDTVADDLRREAEPLEGRRTDGHQTSSSQKQAVDHLSHTDHEVNGAVVMYTAAAQVESWDDHQLPKTVKESNMTERCRNVDN